MKKGLCLTSSVCSNGTYSFISQRRSCRRRVHRQVHDDDFVFDGFNVSHKRQKKIQDVQENENGLESQISLEGIRALFL